VGWLAKAPAATRAAAKEATAMTTLQIVCLLAAVQAVFTVATIAVQVWMSRQ